MNELYAGNRALRLPTLLRVHGFLVATKGLDSSIVLSTVGSGDRLLLELKPFFVRVLCLETLHLLQVTNESVHTAAHLATPRNLGAAMDTVNSLSSSSSSTASLSTKSSSVSSSTSVAVSYFVESIGPMRR